MTPTDDLVTLEDQDRDQWDEVGIATGRRLLQEAMASGGTGPYQLLQAAIAWLQPSARRPELTDWRRMAGLALLDQIEASGALQGYYLIPATRPTCSAG